MPKNHMTFSIDVEYPEVGRLIDDLRHRNGIVAINLADDGKEKKQGGHKVGPKMAQTFSASLLQTLYGEGPCTKDLLENALAMHGKQTPHFSQTLSYLRSTGRVIFIKKTGQWDLSKDYRAHALKALATGANGAVSLKQLAGNLSVKQLPAPSKTKRKLGKMTGADLILKLLTTKQAPVHRDEMKPAFVKAGRSKTSIGDQLSKLIHANKIKRVDQGTYALA